MPTAWSESLSLAAEELLDALDAALESRAEPTPQAWLAALSAIGRADAAVIGAREDLANAGAGAMTLSRQDLIARASAQARSAGHGLVTPEDIVHVLLGAALDAMPSELAGTAEPATTDIAPVADRVMRVFVSSTFRDMQAEREELLKRVFPQVRSLCEGRGVAWGEVDLRWGVTDEQVAEGKVLPICLARIQECRPFFIGLLGDRYGWVPDDLPTELVEREPWLAAHQGSSVTELEILHGVLNDPAMGDEALFYFRSPAYAESRNDAERLQLREQATPEEVERCGFEEAQRRAEERAEKLRALKQRISGIGMAVREYDDPQALGELVLADLRSIIDRRFPEGSEPEPLVREAAEHTAWARSRADVYVGGEAYFERLDRHAAGDGPPLVVLGESGTGKSALLAHWALSRQAADPEQIMVLHFSEASGQSSGWAAMLRRVMGELRRHFDIEGEVPDEPAALRAAFEDWLHRADARGRMVLIVDGLDELEDREGALDLVWLPPVVPANVRLVVSTLPGRPLDEIHRRGWPTLEVQPLQEAERRQLIVEYLAQFGKALADARVDRIAGEPQCASPLYLRVVLEELHVWGDPDPSRLITAIEHYLGARDVAELYERVLARYETDFEGNRPGLVGEAMSLLWAARRGLAEAELLELLGTDGEPLPSAYWSPLYVAVGRSFVNRSGLLGFSHPQLRAAVANRYLPTEEQRRAAHLSLADYFGARDPGGRSIGELPWQLAEGGAWKRLARLLGDLTFFERAWDRDPFEVKAHWARVEASCPLRLVDAYRPVLKNPRRHRDHLWRVARLLQDTGHPAEALALRKHQVEHYRDLDDRAGLAASLGSLATAYWTQGQLDQAMTLHKQEEAIFRELDDLAGLQTSLGNQAIILHDRGEIDAAMALYKEQERICRDLDNGAGLQASLGNQAVILRSQGELHEAMTLHEQEERICRELGDDDSLATCLTNRGVCLRDCSESDRALMLFVEAEQIRRNLGDRAGLVVSLGLRAEILEDRGEFDEALTLYREAEAISRELGDQAGLLTSLSGQGVILRRRGEFDEAMALYKQAEAISRELGDQAGLQLSLGNQAVVLGARGEPAHAMALYKEQERICRDLGLSEGLATCLVNQATLASGEAAVRLAEEGYRLAESSGLLGLAEEIRPFLEELRERAR